MLKKRIIPTLLLKKDVLVKDLNFISKRSIGSVLPTVKVFNLRQVDELILLDIEATQYNRAPNYKLVKRISKFCFVPLTVGGGIKTLEHIMNLLKCGADKISINSIAYEDQQLVREAVKKFGSQCIVVSIDVRKIDGEYICFSHSGTVNCDYTLDQWLKVVNELNVGEILITSIDRDGTMQGYDLDLISFVKNRSNIPIIASGGCSSYEDMFQVFNKTDISAVSASSIFQFTNLTPKEAKQYLHDKGVRVRKVFR